MMLTTLILPLMLQVGPDPARPDTDFAAEVQNRPPREQSVIDAGKRRARPLPQHALNPRRMTRGCAPASARCGAMPRW